MSDLSNPLNTGMVEKYRNNFLKEVEANVEEGDWVKMCMQCGVCSGSCPLGPYWDHPPQELFMMIRAGKRDEVLESTSMWMCTSCYNCTVKNSIFKHNNIFDIFVQNSHRFWIDRDNSFFSCCY